MPIIEIESEWRETGIVCPFCDGEWMTYSNGQRRPQCGNDDCLRVMPDEYIWEWLITLPEFRPTLRAADVSTRRYVAVKTAGVIKVHLPHTDGNYYTLCGEDGDDPSEAVDSVAVNVPKGAKVNCTHCLRIWEVCKMFTAKDFAAPNKA